MNIGTDYKAWTKYLHFRVLGIWRKEKHSSNSFLLPSDCIREGYILPKDRMSVRRACTKCKVTVQDMSLYTLEGLENFWKRRMLVRFLKTFSRS